MSAIGKGDWLQCINPACDGEHGVRNGSVYCVEELVGGGVCDVCGDLGPGLELVGVRRCDSSWCRCYFRPLGGNYKKLTAPPQRVREDA